MRYFNTEGPVVADEDYCIPPLDRVDLEEILFLIERKKYFVLHAPRQTGKTSLLKALAERLNANGKYRCLYINVEAAQTAWDDVAAAIAAVFDEMAKRARIMLGDTSLQMQQDEILANRSPDRALHLFLTWWASASPVPLVLMIDEVDTLVGDALISVLRQLRAGYDLRPKHFPHSVILCGVRDVRDYRIFSTKGQNYTSGGSAFNIKAESLRLGDFTEAEMRALLAQHTAETGQAFDDRAVERVWELTRGQPWLVNALAQETCFKNKSGRDRSRAISEVAIDDAKETFILKRVTHLDQLAGILAEGGRPAADRVVRRPLRGGVGALAGVRPAPGQVMGRADLPAGGARGRGFGHSMGDVRRTQGPAKPAPRNSAVGGGADRGTAAIGFGPCSLSRAKPDRCDHLAHVTRRRQLP